MTSTEAQTILIVDDDHLNHEVLEGILGFAGHSVMHCYHSNEVREKIKETEPALIMLDVRMPDTDGMTLCRQLKASDDTRHIPIIIITGQARDRAQYERALDAGAVDFIERTLDMNALIERIEQHL